MFREVQSSCEGETRLLPHGLVWSKEMLHMCCLNPIHKSWLWRKLHKFPWRKHGNMCSDVLPPNSPAWMRTSAHPRVVGTRYRPYQDTNQEQVSWHSSRETTLSMVGTKRRRLHLRLGTSCCPFLCQGPYIPDCGKAAKGLSE